MTDTSQFSADRTAFPSTGETLLSFRKLGERLRSAGPSDPSVLGVARIVEAELLPRLMVAFQSWGDAPNRDYITQADHARFFEHLLADDPAPILQFIRKMERRGVPMENVLTELMVTAARRLGAMWEDDTLSFTDVTLAIARLQQMLRMNSIVGDPDFRRNDSDAPRILLTTGLGEQHTLSVLVVAEVFRRDGWFVVSEPGALMEDLVRSVASEAFDFIGVSATSERCLEPMGGMVSELRRTSLNPGVQFVVGGGLFQRYPDLAASIDAAFCASEGIDAPRVCRSLLAQSLVGC